MVASFISYSFEQDKKAWAWMSGKTKNMNMKKNAQVFMCLHSVFFSFLKFKAFYWQNK